MTNSTSRTPLILPAATRAAAPDAAGAASASTRPARSSCHRRAASARRRRARRRSRRPERGHDRTAERRPADRRRPTRRRAGSGCAGPAGTLGRCSAPSVELVTSTAPDGRRSTHRQRTGDLSDPPALGDRVIAVLGLDDRPQARAPVPHRRPPAEAAPATRRCSSAPAYAFPADTDGTGQTVAIIELGGGFAQSDLDTYFAGLGLTEPDGDGGRRRRRGEPAGQGSAGRRRRGAARHRGRRRAGPERGDRRLLRAEHRRRVPRRGQRRRPRRVRRRRRSASAGARARTSGPLRRAPRWTARSPTPCSSGIVVTAAVRRQRQHRRRQRRRGPLRLPGIEPERPRLRRHAASNAADGAISAETVWNNGPGKGATGGGVSDAFAAARLAGGHRRAQSPDAGCPMSRGNADPQTGYQVLVDGAAAVIGGTSAVAPLWAALVARLAQATGGAAPRLRRTRSTPARRPA